MADMLEGANFGGGGNFPLEQWFYEMPICTRIWVVLTVAISVLVQCHIVTPLQLFFSVRAVFLKNQVSPLHIRFSGVEKEVFNAQLVLATPHHLPLLRPALPGPPPPRLLPTAIFATPRGESLSVRLPASRLTRRADCRIHLPPPLRGHLPPPDLLFLRLATIPRSRAELRSGIHLVAPESGHAT